MRVGRLLVRTFAAIAALGALNGCDSPEAQSPTPREPGTQYIVGVDVSASRTPVQSAEGQRLLQGLIGRVTHGDRMVIVETYRTGSAAANQWDDTVPSLRRPPAISGGERKALERFKRKAASVSTVFFDSTRSATIMSTDILMTLARAADYAKASNGRETTLVLLSDMLNSTPELNMERQGGIPDAKWVAARKASGRLPDLSGICVFVAGADVTSSRGAAARAFWSDFFAQSGARMAPQNYRNLISDASEISCPA